MSCHICALCKVRKNNAKGTRLLFSRHSYAYFDKEKIQAMLMTFFLGEFSEKDLQKGIEAFLK